MFQRRFVCEITGTSRLNFKEALRSEVGLSSYSLSHVTNSNNTPTLTLSSLMLPVKLTMSFRIHYESPS